MKIFIITLLTFSCLASISRAKITLKGNLRPNITKKFKANHLEKFKTTKIEIFDPYQDDEFLKFDGISLENLFRHFAPHAKKVEVTGMNLYKTTISRDHRDAKNTFFVFKQNGQFINIERMGPMRVIRRGKGKMSGRILASEGADWVWMIKELNFI